MKTTILVKDFLRNVLYRLSISFFSKIIRYWKQFGANESIFQYIFARIKKYGGIETVFKVV